MNYWQIKTYEDFKKIVDDKLYSEKRKEGYFEFTIHDWRLLDSILYTMIDMSHAIFRGVEKSKYTLNPSIFRTWALKHKSSIDNKNEYIERCYDHFIESIRGRRGPASKFLDKNNKYELWSLGRHYGVLNTMLDWSYSPYICLFFAFKDWGKNGIRSLYCLKQNIIEKARQTEIDPKIQDITLTKNPDYNTLLFYKPLSDDNYRMINQQGIFLQ